MYLYLTLEWGLVSIYMKTDSKIKNIDSIIVQHLWEKKDHKDDLDGIALFVYNTEMKNLSDKILIEIAELLSRGLIKESESYPGQKIYQLSDNKTLVSDFLLSKKHN